MKGTNEGRRQEVNKCVSLKYEGKDEGVVGERN